ncbi:hypothetical protein [Christiangramia sp. SM2212]|uniref:ATP synthase F0 subunit 8 n=1 Tax=Christiangramia sediminicola TaxID=3073267 RepID=A0ABU1EPF8_9FLAO|nr:hypothetical protein [Christiangramia sp. SM2212]MDR5590256.1 hypothetical protein [Christiangramia sp. SM2212]
MKQIIKLIDLCLLIVAAVCLIVILLATIVALSPAIALCFIAYQVKEYFVYRKSAHCKLEEKKALKRKTITDFLQHENS